MKVKICINNKDCIAGLLFIFVGIAVVWISGNYPMGVPRRMGPAYFPRIIGGALAIVGFIIFARSLLNAGDPVRLPTIRPLIVVSGAVLSFALLIEHLGLVVALFVLNLISFFGVFGVSRFRLVEFAILYILLVFIAVSVFVYGLGLQFPLWPTV